MAQKIDKKAVYSARYPHGTIVELTALIEDPYGSSKHRLTKKVRFSTLFILLHLGLLLALAVTTATFAFKAPTRPSRTLTGASFFGFVTGLPEHCYKAFIYVGIYGRMLGNYANKDV